ncbi:MAG: hypothetical protein PVG91_09855 [Gammaproteobacteria bacterium]|jgi:hypothetical protein
MERVVQFLDEVDELAVFVHEARARYGRVLLCGFALLLTLLPAVLLT